MDNRTTIIATVIVTAFVASCAKPPEAIAPAYVSEVSYQNFTCDQLATETQQLQAAYTRVAAQQKQARQNDVVGVILIGLPVSSLSGDNVAAQVADVKGRQEAVRLARVKKNCA